MGRPRLPREKVEDILTAWSRGKSQRQIAMALGVSRRSVALVCSGEHASLQPARATAALQNRTPTRCADCGGMIVVAPCRLCLAKARPKQCPSPIARVVGSGVRLRTKAQRDAYLAMRRRREAEAGGKALTDNEARAKYESCHAAVERNDGRRVAKDIEADV